MYKKLNQQGFHHLLMAVLIVVVVAGIGFAGWYVWDKNQAPDDSTNTTNPTVTPTLTTTATPTPIPTAVVVTENELDTLRTFCQGTDPDTVVGKIVYVENAEGKFASCGVGYALIGPGVTIIAYMQNEEWASIVRTQNVLPEAMCNQYNLPGEIGYCDTYLYQ